MSNINTKMQKPMQKLVSFTESEFSNDHKRNQTMAGKLLA
jgi:hypothetical protein